MNLFSFKRPIIKHVSYSELFMSKKEPALTAKQVTSNVTASRCFINNVSDAGNATNGSPGNVRMSKNATGFLGSSFGSTKAIRFEDFLGFPATAPLRSSRSKITGSLKPQKQPPIFQRSNTPFMTAPTSEKTTALWFS